MDSDESRGGDSALPNDPLDHAIVWTPAIKRLANEIASWVRLDSPGGAVTGKPRTGKSFACIYLEAALHTVIGYPVAVLVMSIPRGNSTREREYTQEMMRQCDCMAIQHRDIAVLRARFMDHIAQMADVACAKRVILIIDEAQELSDEHYGYLVHWFNALVHRKLRPFFLLVGQPELKGRTFYWDKNEFHQIAGRFFVHRHSFQGISKEDFSEVLAEFDKIISDGNAGMLLKPLGGLALTDLALPLADALDVAKKRFNLTEEVLLPMQYLRSTLLAFIYRSAKIEGGIEGVNSELMMRCLNDSGFLGVISFYADAPSGDD